MVPANRLERHLEAIRGKELQTMVDAIIEDVEEFTGGCPAESPFQQDA